MTFANFLSILRVRWWVIALAVAMTTATAVGVSLMIPKKYQATASVVVDAKPDPVSALIYPGLASPAFMATQVDVINSDRVSLRVVRNLKLTENAAIREQWLENTQGQGSIEQWLAGSLKSNMDVRPSRESNVIYVNYQSPDPNFAAALANAFVQAYVETALELRVDPARQYNTFFDERAKAARERLESAQAKLSAFQRANGIVVNDERLDVESARLNELSSQLVAIQALSAESSSRQAQAAGASADRMQEVLSNPVVSALKADTNRAEARLQELNTRYGDKHPQVIEARASIAELRSRMDAEITRVIGGTTVTNAINRSRESEIRASLQAQRARVLEIKALRDQSAVLMRDVENAQRAFETVTMRQNQTSLESQSTQSNVNVLTSATPPASAAFPKVPLNAAVALLVGLLMGTGIAVLLEMLDRRVRNDEDVVLELELPLLGVLPKPGSKRSGALRQSTMENRLLGNAVLPGKAA